MNNILPIFTSHYSIGKSILTLEPSGEIDENKPISIFSILKTHNFKELHLCETSFAGFVQAYKQSLKENINLRFGIKFTICSNCENKSENSLLTESKVIVWMKNSNAYQNLIKLYSQIHANEKNFYYKGRGDWNLLKKYWTDNLLLTIPFYDSFIFNNLMYHKHTAIPDFSFTEPIFMKESLHELPFDDIICSAIDEYTSCNKHQKLNTHTIYYYKKQHIKQFSVFKIIQNRGFSNKKVSINNPNLSHFSSNSFCFEKILE